MSGKKIVFVVGTRPEIIKVYPVIRYLNEVGFKDYLIINTGQHKEMADPFWDFFSLKPDYNLEVMQPGQSLPSLFNRSLSMLDELVNELQAKGDVPEIFMAQGDTTTVMAAAFTAFYHKIRFFHLEAGLRTFNLHHPFPEELNRKVSSIIADFHYAPTEQARQNLYKEGVAEEKVIMSGNTVVDALKLITSSPQFDKVLFRDKRIEKAVANSKRLVLITCHRRENHDYLGQIIEAVDELSNEFNDLLFIWPVHKNPKVKDTVYSSALTKAENVILCAPLEYLELLKLMQGSVKIITDSGGIQEEAPSFRVPVLVMRETSERPESQQCGYSILVGSNKQKITEGFRNFNPVFPAESQNPFGDGNAAGIIAKHLISKIMIK